MTVSILPTLPAAAQRQTYTGPIVDAHQHFWDLEKNRYPWLSGSTLVEHRYGDYSSIKKTYLPTDYLRDIGSHHVIGSVYVEAEWDPTDPLGETEYISRLANETGRPNAIAAQAWLDAPDIDSVLAAQKLHARVRSVRHKPGTPNPAGLTLMSHPAWLRGYEMLSRHGLHFELQAPWRQFEEACALARNFPATTLIINHAGVLADRSAQTLRGWHAALSALARYPNVVVKVSGLCEPGKPWTVEANQPVLAALRETFGASRLMFGSNFPVDGMFLTLEQLITGFKQLVAHWQPTEQQAFFLNTALRIYRPLHLHANS